MQVAGDPGPGPVPGELQWGPHPWQDLVRCEVIMNFDPLGPQCDTPALSPEPAESPQEGTFPAVERWDPPGACAGHPRAASGGRAVSPS